MLLQIRFYYCKQGIFYLNLDGHENFGDVFYKFLRFLEDRIRRGEVMKRKTRKI